MGKHRKTKSTSKKSPSKSATAGSSSSVAVEPPSPPDSTNPEETLAPQLPPDGEDSTDFVPSGVVTPTNPIDPHRRRSSQLSPNIKPTPIDVDPVNICDVSPSKMEKEDTSRRSSEGATPDGLKSPTSPRSSRVSYVGGRLSDHYMEVIEHPSPRSSTSGASQPPSTPPQSKSSMNGPSYADVVREEAPDTGKHEREAPWLPEDPSAKKPKIDSTQSSPGISRDPNAPPRGHFSFNPPLTASPAPGNIPKNLDSYMNQFLHSSTSFPPSPLASGAKRPRRNSEILSMLTDRDSIISSLTQRVEKLEHNAGLVHGGDKPAGGKKGEKEGKVARKEKTTTIRYAPETEWGWWVLLVSGAGLLGGWIGAAMESGRFRERVVNVIWRMITPANTAAA
ncbi:hypothetical protein EX30DRAFT_395257 [Ascodesmis nigricans]|uniref:Uncharacterized protein n=1 Tax=Ascodesmis nigricans TaxID=341454 RepID=A0A4S2MZ38_9PEZI|nr:hypothetical protein EX30DRAFT_395257 [Ascodesmis nigricans]